MGGIVSCGVYIPVWRTKRDEISKFTGFQSLGGEKAVSSWDEDSITMAVEASRIAVENENINVAEIDAVLFASTTAPFRVKQSSSFIAAALDLNENIYTMDITGSFRAGVDALIAADNLIKQGKKSVLVVAAENMPFKPSTLNEQLYGDCAVAFVIQRDSKAEIVGHYSIAQPLPGAWSLYGDSEIRDYDPRVDARYGFADAVQRAVMPLLMNLGLNPLELRIALSAPDPKSYVATLKAAGIKPEEFFFTTIGIAGCAHPFLMLANLLSEPGKVIVGGYGEGAAVICIDIKEKVETNLKQMLESKRYLNYGEYMFMKGFIGESAAPDRPSYVKYWRDQKSILRWYGMKCKNCNTISYPISRCCVECGAKDNYEEVRLSSIGKVYTFAMDYLTAPGNYQGDGIHPHVVAVVDFNGGGRSLMEVSDLYRNECVSVDDEVEITFRILTEKTGFRYYGWKVRPPRIIKSEFKSQEVI
jgi:3-hydroxy-3-methylglutaryl CoA synthase